MRGDAAAISVFLAGAVAIAATQLPGRTEQLRIKEGSDAYLLPPPSQLVHMSLGYRAALADLLWADLQVTQGLRLGEKRRHNLTVNYLDAINELDPKWRDPYRMADTLITVQAKSASIEEVREARRILERGVRERPNDAELWFVLGAFMMFIAPNSYMEPGSEEALAWREQGALHLARAAELAPKDSSITWQTLGAARLLAETGHLERTIEMLSTVLATTEDPELRSDVEQRLRVFMREQSEGAADAEQQKRIARAKRMRQLARDHYFLDERLESRKPGSNVETTMLLGPPRDAGVCAGPAADERPGCASNWREWADADNASASEAP